MEYKHQEALLLQHSSEFSAGLGGWLVRHRNKKQTWIAPWFVKRLEFPLDRWSFSELPYNVKNETGSEPRADRGLLASQMRLLEGQKLEEREIFVPPKQFCEKNPLSNIGSRIEFQDFFRFPGVILNFLGFRRCMGTLSPVQDTKNGVQVFPLWEKTFGSPLHNSNLSFSLTTFLFPWNVKSLPPHRLWMYANKLFGGGCVRSLIFWNEDTLQSMLGNFPCWLQNVSCAKSLPWREQWLPSRTPHSFPRKPKLNVCFCRHCKWK